ncbi:hypothetical protein M422DRAFT_251256 [Sphaerobolus stellatus SS14]|uniref:Uncharacterized protein n=1 Tax=Sphaerobolus stellatus (strain SS14) TaxID=990650 RepID=A0A0C9VRL7_SPHS4|nr:hypothetical protein M422DRAFT_251256 [Sphaerobolus stellatus SS14]
MESVQTRPRSHSVRFDDACVLIPPNIAKTRPRLVTKSYSLPLWRSSPSTPRKNSIDEGTMSAEEHGQRAFSLTIAVPSLAIGRPRRPSLTNPVSPCLSKRCLPGHELSTSPTSSPPMVTRSASLKHTHVVPQTERNAVDPNVPTIPLRVCCEECYHTVDASLAQEEWEPYWSPGAIRRHKEKETCLFGITRVWKPQGADVSLSQALRVDEVAVKQQSNSLEPAMMNNHTLPSARTGNIMDSEDEADFSHGDFSMGNLDEEDLPEEDEDVETASPAPMPILEKEEYHHNYILDPSLPDPDAIPMSFSPSSSPERSRSMSPRQQTRRPSLSVASESIFKGSVSVLRGVAASISGSGVRV